MRRTILGLALVLLAGGCAWRASGVPVFSPDGKFVARIDERYYASQTRDLWSYISELLPIELRMAWFSVDTPDNVRSIRVDEGGHDEYVMGEPVFSPDSRYVMMVPTRHLQMIELATGRVREILPKYKEVACLRWVADDRIVYTMSESRGKTWRRSVRRQQIGDRIREPEELYGDEHVDDLESSLYLSPDARHVLGLSADGKGRIHLIDLQSGGVRDVGAAWESFRSNFDRVLWKPDGSAVFVHNHTARLYLLVEAESGKVHDVYPEIRKMLGDMAWPRFSRDWTVDGKYLLMQRQEWDPKPHFDGWLLSPYPWEVIPISERFCRLIGAGPTGWVNARMECIPGWIWVCGPTDWYMLNYAGTRAIPKSTFETPNPTENDLEEWRRAPWWFQISPDGRREVLSFRAQQWKGYDRALFREIRFPPSGLEPPADGR